MSSNSQRCRFEGFHVGKAEDECGLKGCGLWPVFYGDSAHPPPPPESAESEKGTYLPCVPRTHGEGTAAAQGSVVTATPNDNLACSLLLQTDPPHAPTSPPPPPPKANPPYHPTTPPHPSPPMCLWLTHVTHKMRAG